MSYVYYISLNRNEGLIDETSDHEGNKMREYVAEGRGMTLSEYKKRAYIVVVSPPKWACISTCCPKVIPCLLNSFLSPTRTKPTV